MATMLVCPLFLAVPRKVRVWAQVVSRSTPSANHLPRDTHYIAHVTALQQLAWLILKRAAQMPCHNPYYQTQLTPHVILHMPHDIFVDRATTELLLSRSYLARHCATYLRSRPQHCSLKPQTPCPNPDHPTHCFNTYIKHALHVSHGRPGPSAALLLSSSYLAHHCATSLRSRPQHC